MLNIFRDEGEPIKLEAYLCFLFEKCQHPELQTAIQAMKTQVTMGSHLLTFTVAANHFTSELSSITDFFPDLTKKNVCAFRTYARHVCSVRPTTQQRKRPGIHESSIEFDSHVGTIVFGRNFLLLCHNGKECSVAPYNDAYDSINNVPIVSAATAWTSNSSG